MVPSGKNVARGTNTVLFRHDSEELDKAYAEGERLMKGVKALACLGDPLALASFSLIPPIRKSLVGACTKESEALEMLSNDTPNVLFTSELLEQGYGIDLVRRVKADTPSALCLLFLRRETADVVTEAMEAGADACMFVSALSADGDSDFLQALRATLSGGTYYPRSVRDVVKKELSAPPPWEKELTVRELEVLRRLCEGGSNDEIATDLNVSVSTVKAHLRALYQKIGTSERTKLLVTALKAGTVS